MAPQRVVDEDVDGWILLLETCISCRHGFHKLEDAVGGMRFYGIGWGRRLGDIGSGSPRLW